MNKVVVIKCDYCGINFLETKEGIKFIGDICPYCGTISVNDKKVLHKIKVDETKLNTMEIAED